MFVRWRQRNPQPLVALGSGVRRHVHSVGECKGAFSWNGSGRSAVRSRAYRAESDEQNECGQKGQGSLLHGASLLRWVPCAASDPEYMISRRVVEWRWRAGGEIPGK